MWPRRRPAFAIGDRIDEPGDDPKTFSHGGAHCHAPNSLKWVWDGTHPMRRAGANLPGDGPGKVEVIRQWLGQGGDDSPVTCRGVDRPLGEVVSASYVHMDRDQCWLAALAAAGLLRELPDGNAAVPGGRTFSAMATMLAPSGIYLTKPDTMRTLAELLARGTVALT